MFLHRSRLHWAYCRISELWSHVLCLSRAVGSTLYIKKHTCNSCTAAASIEECHHVWSSLSQFVSMVWFLPSGSAWWILTSPLSQGPFSSQGLPSAGSPCWYFSISLVPHCICSPWVSSEPALKAFPIRNHPPPRTFLLWVARSWKTLSPFCLISILRCFSRLTFPLTMATIF